MKLLITGANGRVGSALCAYFLQRGDEVIPVARAEVDLANLEALRSFLLDQEFDCLINPAAMSAPDQCEREPELAHRINAEAPEVMAEIAALRGARMIHFSTDYVFAGDQPGKRSEEDAAVPRTAAALPAPVGDLAEPTPPSPIIDTPETADTPGTVARFGIGWAATDEEIAAIDIDIMPDGTGLPEGNGTYQQGETLYVEQCASCHGDNLEGIKATGAPALMGGRDSLSTRVKTQ